jgi:hypothetical protein
MDPAQRDSQYRFDRIAVPSSAPAVPATPDAARDALAAYCRVFERLLAGYHILDRNYTYDFHNELFVRHTPLLPDYRARGLALVADARGQWKVADQKAAAVRATLANGDPLGALLDDVRGFAAFSFERAPVLERMTGGFERTKAGLQHAAHLYEGEGKYLGTGLLEIVTKHAAVVDAPAMGPVTSEFARSSREIFAAYAHHIVGF